LQRKIIQGPNKKPNILKQQKFFLISSSKRNRIFISQLTKKLKKQFARNFALTGLRFSFDQFKTKIS
jgi:hypothetical protein